MENLVDLIASQKLALTRKLHNFFRNTDVIEDMVPITSDFFLHTGDYLSKNVKYFSMNQLIKYSLYKKNFSQSYLYATKKANIKVLDFPGSEFTFQIKGEKVDKINEKFVHFLPINNLSYLFKKSNLLLYNALLKAKICSSSFFLHEWFELNEHLPFMSKNFFFPTWEQWEKWKKNLKVNCLMEKMPFSTCFEYNYVQKTEVNIDFVPISNNTFYPFAIGEHREINCLLNYIPFMNVNVQPPFQRKIEVNIPNHYYENDFDFYMHSVLKLDCISWRSVIEKDIINSNNFVDNIKCHITFEEKKMFYNGKRAFLYWNNINKAKRKARKESLNSFIAINIEKQTVEEVGVRKLNPWKTSCLITY